MTLRVCSPSWSAGEGFGCWVWETDWRSRMVLSSAERSCLIWAGVSMGSVWSTCNFSTRALTTNVSSFTSTLRSSKSVFRPASSASLPSLAVVAAIWRLISDALREKSERCFEPEFRCESERRDCRCELNLDCCRLDACERMLRNSVVRSWIWTRAMLRQERQWAGRDSRRSVEVYNDTKSQCSPGGGGVRP